MTQELLDLRLSILEGRYEDALVIVDELEGIGKQAILRNIQSFLTRLMVHLIKNQIEQRLTNSWAASISGSIVEIKRLNLQDNKTAYYVKSDEWQSMLEEALEAAIAPASLEVMDGRLRRSQLSMQLDKPRLISTATELLSLTYAHSAKELPAVLDQHFKQLPGCEDWD